MSSGSTFLARQLGRSSTGQAPTSRQSAHGDAWNFSRISLFSPDRSSHPQILQPKLAIGRVDDPLEHEADSIAEHVMRMPDAGFSVTPAAPQISRKCAACEEEETQKVQTKSVTPHQVPAVAPGIVHDVLRSPGQALSRDERSFMEPRLGRDLGAIRIHTDAEAMRSASAVNALAFTVGHHIVFARDQYAPGTDVGRRLLAHELAHTIQQEGLRPVESNASAPMPVVARSGPSLQRACDQPESFYKSSPAFCRDDSFSPSTHPGKTCYREIIQSYFGCPPGDHCCFAPDGTVEDSHDTTSLASSKDESDGSCGWRWSCIARHTVTDYVPAVVGQALSPLTCAAQCASSGAPELCTQSCIQQAHAQ